MTVVVESDQRRSHDDRAPSLASLALWLIGLVLSVIAFLIFNYSSGSVATDSFPFLGCLFHLLSVAVAYFATRFARGVHHPAARGWSVLVSFFAMFGGPLGYLAGVLCYLYGVGQPTELPLVDVVRAEMWIKPAMGVDKDEIPSFEVQLREELRTQPIVDLLPFADIPTAIAIINKLVETRSRDDVNLLQQMTQDRRPEVYQYAVSKVDEMEKEFGQKIFQVHEQLRYRPNDPGLRVELAKLYLGYTESGLLDGSLEDYYWELTLAQLFEAIRYDETNRRELVVDLARMFLVKGLYREAQSIVEEVVRREPSNVAAQMLILESMVERAQKENNPELVAQARRHARENSWAVRVPARRENSPNFEVAQFWFGRAREKSGG